jgi:hypothetical protein
MDIKVTTKKVDRHSLDDSTIETLDIENNSLNYLPYNNVIEKEKSTISHHINRVSISLLLNFQNNNIIEASPNSDFQPDNPLTRQPHTSNHDPINMPSTPTLQYPYRNYPSLSHLPISPISIKNQTTPNKTFMPLRPHPRVHIYNGHSPQKYSPIPKTPPNRRVKKSAQLVPLNEKETVTINFPSKTKTRQIILTFKDHVR